jgi:Zn-dependent protease with chaperone function
MLSFKTKRFAAISLVILGVLSVGVLFVPLTLRLVYAIVFMALTMVSLLSTVNMITGSIITQVQVTFYNRKHKPRVEIWPEIKETTKRLGIQHSGEIFITSCPSINNAWVNLSTKKIMISESWLKQFHRTETVATLGHELGHIKGQRRFTSELLSVFFGSIAFILGFSIAAISFRLPVIPIFLQITTFTLMMLMLSLVLWRNEYRADMYGALATSPEALIAVFEGLQGIRQSKGKKDQGSETHPPLHSRINPQ